MSITTRLLLTACLALPGTSSATPPGDEVASEVEATLTSLAERGVLGSADQPLTVTRPAQVRYELGAVVDVRAPDPRGIEVLAITPGGTAAGMGLKAGDRLLAINGHRLDGDASPATVLKKAILDSDGNVRLLAARGDSRIELAGQAEPMPIPAYRLVVGETEAVSPRAGDCGYVSNSALPPHSKGLFEVDITQVDGRSTSLSRVDRLRLTSGRHVLTVGEMIPGYRLSMTQNRQRMRTRQRMMANFLKPMVVDIKPDTDYRIGARLRKDKLDSRSIRENEYWEPVVWETRVTRCE